MIKDIRNIDETSCIFNMKLLFKLVDEHFRPGELPHYLQNQAGASGASKKGMPGYMQVNAVEIQISSIFDAFSTIMNY